MDLYIPGLKYSSSVNRVKTVSKCFRIQLNFADLFGCFSFRKILLESVLSSAQPGSFSDSSGSSFLLDIFFGNLLGLDLLLNFLFLILNTLFNSTNAGDFPVVLFLPFPFLCS